MCNSRLPVAMAVTQSNLNVFSIFHDPENVGVHTLITQIKGIVIEIYTILVILIMAIANVINGFYENCPKLPGPHPCNINREG